VSRVQSPGRKPKAYLTVATSLVLAYQLELGWCQVFKSFSVFGFSARIYHCLSNNTTADTLCLPLSPEWGLGPRICITNCERYYRPPAAPSQSPKMGNGVLKICIAICGQTVTASDIVTIDSLPLSLSICANSDPLSLPVPSTWGARFHDCRLKRQCTGDAAFAKVLWPLLRFIMVF